MSGADRHTFAAGGAAPAQNRCTSLRLHARSKPVGFHAMAAVGLKGTFGHVDPLLFLKKNLRVSNIFKYILGGTRNPASELHDTTLHA